MSKILCSVATRGRYHTTLPLVLMAIVNQYKTPDKLVIFDDNDEPQDMRKEHVYQCIFQMLEAKGIAWEWFFAQKKGQHHIHQHANEMAVREGYEFVWRVDDDAVPEFNVLERLYTFARTPKGDVGAVGGAVLTLPVKVDTSHSTGKIDDIDNEPNIQWAPIEYVKEVEHLHCTFLYRAGLHDFNLGLSRVAHREETLFTYGIHQKGYKVLVVPNATTWHLKSPTGGIRSETQLAMFEHDERIFRNTIEYKDKAVVVLNSGLGDHIVFSRIFPDIPDCVVFGCYPEVLPCRSIEEAKQLFGDIEQHNIYKKMDLWNWKGSLEDAYRKLYL